MKAAVNLINAGKEDDAAVFKPLERFRCAFCKFSNEFGIAAIITGF